MLDLNTKVELVAIQGERCLKKIMTYGEALETPHVKGWHYYIYQIGFCSIKTKE